MRSEHGIRNAVLIVLCVILAALLAWMMYMSEQSGKTRQEAAEDLKTQAKQYEEELAQIRSDLSEKEKNIAYVSETAEIMIGFVISEETDIDYIKSAAEKFDIQPVVIVNCADDLSKVKSLIDAASNTGWEIMLTASSFSGNVNEKIVEILSYMKDLGAKNADVFLLRNDFYTNKNVQTLIDDGFVGYTKYNQSAPSAGVTGEGYVYFDYSYLQSMQTSVAERLYALCLNKAALIVAFDMDALRSEAVTEEYVEKLFELIQGYEADGQCGIASVQDVILELSAANQTEEERRAKYEEYAAQQQERIDELEKTIREIYNQMG